MANRIGKTAAGISETQLIFISNNQLKKIAGATNQSKASKGKFMEKLKSIGISQELFEEWRKPRFGSSNPTLSNNPVWNWLIKTKISAWEANKASEHDFYNDGPTWCFDRFGQSTTELSDGRIIYIGGEHEDYYDPDFYIYNDVVVEQPDGSIDIFIYPQNVFPSTDSHSATLVGDKIIIIGCLGYPMQREMEDTHVFILDTNTFSISKMETNGHKPGWIYKHSAHLTDDAKAISIYFGMRYRGKNLSIIENIDEWNLNLATGSWKQTKKNNWPRWQYLRADKKSNFLWDLRQLLWNQNAGWKESYEKDLRKLTEALGYQPDLSILESLYQPPIEFELLPNQEDEYNQIQILIEGVVVRYKEEHWELQVTVEGTLQPHIITLLKQDLYQKLSNLVKTHWEMTDIEA